MSPFDLHTHSTISDGTLTPARLVQRALARGLDVIVSLILLGLVAFDPIGTAFNNLGDLQAGAWLALAGGILAAGGTWAARGMEMPQAAPSPA
jgi:hypothetical protein